MSLIQAILLGLVQGLTEFLPVSSSGHLALAEHFLGFKNLEQLVLFGLVCHLGTLGAVFTIFWKDILEFLQNRKLFLTVVVGTLPLFPLALMIKPLKDLFDRLDLLGFFFILTACLIYAGAKCKPLKKAPQKLDPLYIGLFQALAIVPGVSRSGSTISGAQMLGWSADKAVKFSFLLAIPAILGGFTLEVWHVLKQPAGSYMTIVQELPTLLVGCAVSYISGLFALKFLLLWVKEKNLLPFAWYCLILGITTLILFN